MRPLLCSLLFLILFGLNHNTVNASINWDGPGNAAIDQLALTLQALGFENAGVRPFGYGFEILSPEDENDEAIATTTTTSGEEDDARTAEQQEEPNAEEKSFFFEIGTGWVPH